MKKTKLKILFLFMILSAISMRAIGKTVTVPISATATVISSFGIVPNSNDPQLLSINEPNYYKLSIQVPKNSSLVIHLSNKNNFDKDISYLLTESLNMPTFKNSVSDFLSLDLSTMYIQNESQQIITILTIDN